MKNSIVFTLAGVCWAPVVFADPAPENRDAAAEQVLKSSCEFLAQAKTFAVQVEVWKDVTLLDGAPVQTSRQLQVTGHRPDRLQIEVRSPKVSRGFWLAGKSLNVLDRQADLYGNVEVPGTIDQAVDTVEERFGLQIPLADFLVSDPYADLVEGLKSSSSFGSVNVLGTECTHLAFSSDNADWQIWISQGAKPLPKKVVYQFKGSQGPSRVTQIFTNWEINPTLADSVFEFVPPVSAGKIELLSEAQAEPAPETKPEKSKE